MSESDFKRHNYKTVVTFPAVFDNTMTVELRSSVDCAVKLLIDRR